MAITLSWYDERPSLFTHTRLDFPAHIKREKVQTGIDNADSEHGVQAANRPALAFLIFIERCRSAARLSIREPATGWLIWRSRCAGLGLVPHDCYTQGEHHRHVGFSMSYRIASVTLLVVAVAMCSSCGRTEPATEVPSSSGASNISDPETVKLDPSKDWKPCAAMPAEVAGNAIGVPANQMETHEFGRICIQERAGGSESTEAYAQLGAFNVFETAQRARARFEASTKDTSATEMDKINNEIRAKAKKQLGTEADPQIKQDAADQIMDALAGEVSYKSVDNVGDAAAMNVQSGQLHVLAGNVYFYLLAWSGPTIGDRSAPSTEAIEEARKKHLSANWDKQKKLQAELASSIIDHLRSQ
ncbi:MAG TPA: hypothetical protein VJ902_05330 [Wenzhouxiangellaceae bacterium]|nr:hypothetical protein [Wenzhouxiangellaceae bacterium]